jgi:hypothetical protein
VVCNVTYDHARRIKSAHAPFPGAGNDKNIARTDPFVWAVRYNSMYLNFKYPMSGYMGASHSMTGRTGVPYILWYACLLCVLCCLTIAMFHVMPLYIKVHGFSMAIAATSGG